MPPIGKDKYFHKKSEFKSISSALDEIETALGKIDGSQGPIAEKIFNLMDEILEQEKFLHADERLKFQTQYNYISKRIYSAAKLLVKTVGGVAALQEKRKGKGLGSEHWWWYLDHYLDQKRKKGIKRAGVIAVIVMVLIAALSVVYDKFIAPPPEVRARLDYETRIDDYIFAGDYMSAMSEMEKALALAPDYYPLWIKRGVLEKVSGNEAEAQSSFAKAQQLVDNQEYFYYERANVSMQLGLLDDVLKDADQLLEINAQSAEAYLFRGLVFETRGQNDQAQSAYEKAADLAIDQNKSQLAATIRVRMGMLMQSVSIPTPEE